jgi:hypothetical protein
MGYTGAMQTPITILAIAGSLRAASLNTALLHAITRLAPADYTIRIYQGLGELPLFNPDLDADSLPAVTGLRDAILAANVLMLASPEDAHGVSGPMKNALDWMVGNESFIDKPLVLLLAARHACAGGLARDGAHPVGARDRRGLHQPASPGVGSRCGGYRRRPGIAPGQPRYAAVHQVIFMTLCTFR